MKLYFKKVRILFFLEEFCDISEGEIIEFFLDFFFFLLGRIIARCISVGVGDGH